MIEAVLFDLDDTLFPQEQWLAGAWSAVAAAAASDFGVDATPLRDALTAIAGEGSARGNIIDRALDMVGAPSTAAGRLVEVFKSFVAPQLDPYPGVVDALAALRQVVPIGLVTDGDVEVQQGKLRSLGLDAAFDVIVLSDGLGRRYRKPDPAPFLLALERLGASPDVVVFVGDRPDKDVGGASGVGMRAIRVRTGEYTWMPDETVPWATAEDILAAVAVIQREIAAASAIAADPLR